MSDSAYLTDSSEIVGHAEEIERLTQWLLEEKQDRSLIAILGMGGLGKTTIASSVYKNQKIRRSFDCHTWVTLPQTYQVEELLREIMSQLIEQRASMASGFMTMSRMRLVEIIQSHLRDKKYLIVLDDVWDKDAWLFLNYAFVRNNCGSKVLITTRRKDVSYLAVHDRIIELKTLNYAESWELFCKKAFCASKDNRCPKNLRTLAGKIVDKCQALPVGVLSEYLSLWDMLVDVQLQPGSSDTHIWRLSTTGQYTAKSAYEAMFEGVVKFEAAERIWKSWAPGKCRFFIWLVEHDRCWTADRLAHRGMSHPERCPLCDQEQETTNYLLTGCVFSRQFWFNYLQQVGLQELSPQPGDNSFDNWWRMCCDRVVGQAKEGLNSMIILGSWMLWKHRNQCTFDGKSPSIAAVLLASKEEATLWSMAGAKGISFLQALVPIEYRGWS